VKTGSYYLAVALVAFSSTLSAETIEFTFKATVDSINLPEGQALVEMVQPDTLVKGSLQIDSSIVRGIKKRNASGVGWDSAHWFNAVSALTISEPIAIKLTSGSMVTEPDKLVLRRTYQGCKDDVGGALACRSEGLVTSVGPDPDQKHAYVPTRYYMIQSGERSVVQPQDGNTVAALKDNLVEFEKMVGKGSTKLLLALINPNESSARNSSELIAAARKLKLIMTLTELESSGL